jgi:glutamate-1-semialdehyde 2,1-aminomutase
MRHILNECYDIPERASEAKEKYIKINGRWMLDTSMGAGSLIFGHGTIANEIKEDLNKGSLFIVPNDTADKCSELLNEITGFDKFVFCNSGTEATMRAIRIARAYTSREKIILFEGFWHGTSDYFLTPYSKGIPECIKDLTLIMKFDEMTLERIKQKDIACVVVEPIQSSLPIDRREYLKTLKKVCEENGTVLCFDEVISGFRMGTNGATEYLGVTPDLVTYGKIIGGGFPIGVVGGNQVMEVIKTGVRMGGTFSSNPFTMSACLSVLNKLKSSDIYSQIFQTINKLTDIKTDLFHFMSLGGMARLMFTNSLITSIEARNSKEYPINIQNKILKQLRERGLYVSNNHNFLLSQQHNFEDIRFIKDTLESIHL